METGNKKALSAILVANGLVMVFATVQLFRQGDFWLGVMTVGTTSIYAVTMWRQYGRPQGNP